MKSRSGYLLLFALTLTGCEDSQRRNSAEQPSRPAPIEVAPPSDGRHIYLSNRDLATELAKHCDAADSSLRAASEMTMSEPNTEHIRRKISDAVREMRECMKLVHGISEQTFGPESEQR